MKKEKAKDPNSEDSKFPLPIYSKDEDIYSKEKEVSLDEDEMKSGHSASAGSDLDVPGSELDDADENLGEEDEENNYYSLGGDAHEDLEETNDDNR